MKKSIQLLLLSLMLALSLAACRLSPAETPVPATDVPPFQIITATPEPTTEVIDTVTKEDETVSDNEDNTSSNSNSSGSTGSSSNNYNYVPPCYPRSDWPYTYTVVRGDTLSVIARRTGTTVSALVAGNCLTNANVISVGQRLYVPNEAVYQPQLTFSTISPTVSRSYIQSSNPLFYVSWTVSDRPPNSNLRFDQIMPNGSIVNVELPRTDSYVASEGNGYVRLRNPGNVNQIILMMSLYNTVNGSTIRYRQLTVPILDEPPTATPVGYPYSCTGISNTTTTIYNGFQGTGTQVVGTIAANTPIEVLTREFNGYYGVRAYSQDSDIAWAAPGLSVYGNCNNLPDYWHYTGHGSGIPYTCYAVENHPTELLSVFQGSSATVVATIPTGTAMEIVTREFNQHYGVHYGPDKYDVGWIGTESITARGDCANLPDYGEYIGQDDGTGNNGRSCVFVADTIVPIYTTPALDTDILHTTEVGETYQFNAYGDQWQSGDKTGYWLEIIYDSSTSQKAYIQNTGGHLQGADCPSNQS